jgi:L-2,4-diaminobutyrate decarboxylase
MSTDHGALAKIAADASAETGYRFADLVARYFDRAAREDGAVSGADLSAVAAAYDEPIPREGRPVGEILARIEREVIENANWLSHPMYVGHQVSAPLPIATWTDMVAAALNQSLAVREMSPSITPLERRFIGWMCELAGFGAGSGGTFTSGGTEATFTALLAARASLMKNAWAEGVSGSLPVVFCGQHAHYAVMRAVGQLGLGTRRAVTVPSESYQMSTAALKHALEHAKHEGVAVMAVVATSGSTATGSFDDLGAIADLCDEHGVWLHVDGAHGASALMSERHRHRMNGVERARSVAWDPHKMMLLPLSAGMVIVRDERDLERAFAQDAPYLFHGATESPDLGTRSFQCSRRSDVLKAWVALQRFGLNGMGELYDGLCATAVALHGLLDAHRSFETLHEPESNILCFRWVGDGSLPDDRLDELNRLARENYNASGEGWITTTVLDGRRVLRVAIMNPRTQAAHLERLVAGLDRVARSL